MASNAYSLTASPSAYGGGEARRGGCFRNRKTLEWVGFATGFTGLIPLFLAISYWGECEAIPSLEAGMVFFSISASSNALVKFALRDPKEGSGKVVMDLLGLSCLGCGVWLAAVVYPKFSVRKTMACNSAVYQSAVTCASIIMFVVLALVLGFVRWCVTGKNPFEKKEMESDISDDYKEIF